MKDFYNYKPLFFAHRGYLKNNPENTLSSFNAAINKGARAIEVDVIMTKDNQIICSHNYDMSIETELQEDASKIEYAKIQKANIFTNNKEEQEHIPKLIDVLKLIPDETKVNIEVKTKKLGDISIARRVVETVKKEKAQNRVLISSFNPLLLWYIKWLDKKLRTGFLYDNPKLLFLKNLIHPDCLHPNERLVSKNLVKYCHDRGHYINVWTANNRSSIQWLIELEVDGVITDNPEFFI